jgi:hypothetical protein
MRTSTRRAFLLAVDQAWIDAIWILDSGSAFSIRGRCENILIFARIVVLQMDKRSYRRRPIVIEILAGKPRHSCRSGGKR